jgi:NAD(P)H-dependent flavin oxidoreductase YrpB (nitropropane dioxygenase family)
MPLQGMVTMEMITRTHRYADKAQKVAFNPVGQVVGMMNESRSVRQTIQGLVEEYLGAVDRLQRLMPDAG